MEAVVKIEKLGKKFSRKRDKSRTIKSFTLGKLLKRTEAEDFWALRDVDFSVYKGETLGIIGANGAGKSTLLSLVARTTAPTEGTVHVNGRMSTLLELGAGFHPDLTGEENIFLNASILGMSRKETEEKFSEIIKLADIGDAIDSPVKFYSSGMYVRLGFAVAVMCDPDILLMDEILAVGDESFRKKSLKRVEQFRASGKTMLIVSHDLETIKRMADRVLLLDHGAVKDLGEPLEIVEQYKNFGVYQDGDVAVKEYGTREALIQDVKFNGQSGKEVEIKSGDDLKVSFSVKSSIDISNAVTGFSISDNMGNVFFGSNTQILGKKIDLAKGVSSFNLKIDKVPLSRGMYYFSLALHSFDHKTQYHRLDNTWKLRFSSKSESEGLLLLPFKYEVEGV